MTIASGLYRFGAMTAGLYGATQDWYLRLNSAINGAVEGISNNQFSLERLLDSAGSGRPVVELVPYSLALLLAIGAGSRYLGGSNAHQAPQRAPVPHQV